MFHKYGSSVKAWCPLHHPFILQQSEHCVCVCVFLPLSERCVCICVFLVLLRFPAALTVSVGGWPWFPFYFTRHRNLSPVGGRSEMLSIHSPAGRGARGWVHFLMSWRQMFLLIYEAYLRPSSDGLNWWSRTGFLIPVQPWQDVGLCVDVTKPLDLKWTKCRAT